MKKLFLIFFLLTTYLFIPSLVEGLPTAISAHGGEHDELIIRMSKEGFEPKELTVWAGEEVLFINNDDVPRWPASDFHPTHSIYPEFDSLESIAPGESWQMIFEKVGTWRMHDHLIPHMKGTIVVLEDPEKAIEEVGVENTETSIFSKIKNFFVNLWGKITGEKVSAKIDPKLLAEFKSLDEGSKYTRLEEVAKNDGASIAWQYVLKTYNTPKGTVGNPHDMAHLVGLLIYKERGLQGLSVCDTSFAFGCYHGLMEVALYDEEAGTYEERLSSSQSGCRVLGSDDSPTYWSCIHGIGHGIATYRDHDIARALSDCDLLDEKIRTYCHDGVFMEFSISAPPSFYNRNNPIYPCDIVDESYKVACARSQVQVMRLRFGLETGAVANACLATGNASIVYHCVDALGYFTAQESNGRVENIISGCKKIQNEEASAQCLSAAAGELVFQNYAGWQKSAPEICSTLSGTYRDKCLERVDNVKQSYGRK